MATATTGRMPLEALFPRSHIRTPAATVMEQRMLFNSQFGETHTVRCGLKTPISIRLAEHQIDKRRTGEALQTESCIRNASVAGPCRHSTAARS